VFDLTRVRNLKKTRFCVFCQFFDFLRFRRAGVARTSRGRRAKRRANAISSFRRCFVSHDQCRREPQISFEISLKGCLRNFLRVFFFFADFVERSNGLAKAVAHMIRLINLCHITPHHATPCHTTPHHVTTSHHTTPHHSHHTTSHHTTPHHTTPHHTTPHYTTHHTMPLNVTQTQTQT
jgi:hypothetical protein